MQLREKRCQGKNCRNVFVGNGWRKFCDACKAKKTTMFRYRNSSPYRKAKNAYSHTYRQRHGRHINEYNKLWMKIRRLEDKLDVTPLKDEQVRLALRGQQKELEQQMAELRTLRKQRKQPSGVIANSLVECKQCGLRLLPKDVSCPRCGNIKPLPTRGLRKQLT